MLHCASVGVSDGVTVWCMPMVDDIHRLASADVGEMLRMEVNQGLRTFHRPWQPSATGLGRDPAPKGPWRE